MFFGGVMDNDNDGHSYRFFYEIMMGIVVLDYHCTCFYDDDFLVSTTAAYNKSNPNIHLLWHIVLFFW